MKYNGKIKKLDHIILSDPMYKSNGWCRYEKENINGKNWLVDIELNTENSNVEFTLLLKKDKDTCELTDDNAIAYSETVETKEYKIGADSACIAFGINDKAEIINNSHGEWQPSCAIKTGRDGIIANVIEGTDKNNLEFLLICGCLDEDICNENKLLKYLKKQFEIVDLIQKKDKDVIIEKKEQLCIGDIVEVSHCSITNDVGGTTCIRNSNYKNVLDGINLTVENPDGTIKHTVLESHDSLVNIPIEVEVIDGFRDYETGYRFKGKINNHKLKDEFKKIGTTGYTPEDYKKYGESHYKEVLEANKNYDPTTVYFSEFDIIKKLDKKNEQQLEF